MPKNYYNEIDPYAAQWLRNLIAADLIASGEVDERSILDVRADDLKSFTQCHFFAGIGGWSHALRLAGWPDERPVWTGSCPCQPFSAAGKRKGFDDDRHLWPAFRFLISERRPATVFGEQVASATEWLGLVRSDLENLDYAVGAIPIEAASAGADHKRDRFWIVGHDTRARYGHPIVATGSGDLAIAERPNQRRHASNPRSPASAGSGEARSADGNTADGPRPSGCGLGDSDSPRPDAYARVHSEEESTGTRHVDAEGSGDVGHAAGGERRVREPHARGGRPGALGGPGADYEWVIGADGKARRVKPGVRLLAHGIPNRVGKLRGFGNAIDPRPAAQFIGAFMECRP